MLTFDPGNYLNEVILVGCGGTGAQLARSIARIIRMMQDSDKSVPKTIRFIDPDIIEMTNVGRQLFTNQMCGMNKAVELARRFNMALGLNIEAIPEPFDPDRHVKRNSSAIILGAVDNWKARKAMSIVEGATWIDCGNSRYTGQVIIGNTHNAETMTRALKNVKPQTTGIRYLPHAGMLYPELLAPDPEEERLAQTLSCAELMELSLQSATVNQLVASVAAEYFRKIMYREDIKTWYTHISTTTLSMRSEPITLDSILINTPMLDHITLASTD